MPKLRHYMLIIISVSILSLLLSIISLAKEDHAGRYQVFHHGGSLTYLIDTKTSRLFLRNTIGNKSMSIDFGTIEQPLPFTMKQFERLCRVESDDWAISE